MEVNGHDWKILRALKKMDWISAINIISENPKSMLHLLSKPVTAYAWKLVNTQLD